MIETKERYKYFNTPTKYVDCLKELLSKSELELLKDNKATLTILHCVEYPFGSGIEELSLIYKEIE